MESFDKLPKEFRDIINEYGDHGRRALRNAVANNTPIERVQLELKTLRQQNRI